MKEDYEFPRLYVEGAEGPETLEVTLRGSQDREGAVKITMGLVPYESGWSLVLDPSSSVTVKRFIVKLPASGKSILVNRGVRVKLVEVRGLEVYIAAREGDYVRRGDVIAYVETGKGEIRKVKSEDEGLVIYIAWVPEGRHSRHVYVLAREDDVSWL